MLTWRNLATVWLVVILCELVAAESTIESALLWFPSEAGAISCSPAPCVFQPVEASEGGSLVNTSPVAVNPLNDKQLLLGSIDFNCPEPSISGFHESVDGGATWNRFCFPVVQSEGYVYWPGGNPMVGYDAAGTAFAFDQYGDSETGEHGFIAFEKSQDGIHWTKPKKALDIPRTYIVAGGLAIDVVPTSPYFASIYVATVVAGPSGDDSHNRVIVSHSRDSGNTWIQVAVGPEQIAPSGYRDTTLAVGRDGTIYLAWRYCNSGPFYFCSDNKSHMVFSKSSDGGKTWSFPTLITTVVLGPGLPNTKLGTSDIPVIGVDNSDGLRSGNLYVVMYNWTGTYIQVGIIRSTDGGNTWSNPTPVAPLKETHDQFFPWLSVSPTGLIGVSWLDRRNDPANIDYQAFAAISRDGGQSFQPNIQLTTAFSDPNVNGYPGGLWMGDYTGNTWVGSKFIAAWMDSSNGVDMQEVVGGVRVH